MIEKQLGKIERAEYGAGGYNDAMHGISFTLSWPGGGVGDFWGAWGAEIEHTPHCKWTEAERMAQHANTCMRISRLLKDAKRQSVSQLKGVPVEVTVEGNGLKSWRVLTEVL